jgi:hypothetical protein
LHEIAKPLVVEEMAAITKLKDLEVGHYSEWGYFLALMYVNSLLSFTGSDRSIHLWS